MAVQKNYFIWNKELDYLRGFAENLIFSEEGFCLGERGAEEGNRERGVFWSRVLDGREKEMIWHRLRTETPGGQDGFWRMEIYACDRKQIFWGDEVFSPEELIFAAEYSTEEKKERMASCLKQTVVLTEDVLLHQVKGRYLWFCLELEKRGEKSPCIRRIRIDFPKSSWIEYLPEVYQREEKSRAFLERYLGIFQSPYEDMAERIEKSAGQFDPDSAKEEFLPWLAEWVALEDASIWNAQQLRYLLKHAMELYKIRGTAEYLKRLLRIYTDSEIFVVEHHQISRFQSQPGAYERLKALYGEHAYMFTIVVNTKERDVQRDYHTLMKIVEHAIPAYMEYRIVQLQQYIFLGQYSYLGINSCLGRHRPLQLDGLSAMHFSRIERKGEGEEN